MAVAKGKDPVMDSMKTVTGWLHHVSDFGLALILTFVIIDILFPGSTGVMKNLGIIVGQFSKEGLAGLVALLMFLVFFKNRQPG